MFLSAAILPAIEAVLESSPAHKGAVTSVRPVSGGSINQCYEVRTNSTICFLKTCRAAKYPDIFLAEAEGLKRITQTNTIAVPDVMGHGRAGDELFLMLTWIDAFDNTHPSGHYQLGRQLADMHRHSSDRFGLDHNNYIGSLPQRNKQHTTWHEFYISERVQPQLELSLHNKLINNELYKKFHTMFKQLADLYPEEKPALVHGDLWSGNYIISSKGIPFLIDPAIYYGNRETDIAMSTLFGGFSDEFYRGYNDQFQLQPGWRERLDLWNLYPLLVHLNLFGSGYLSQIEPIIRRFV